MNDLKPAFLESPMVSRRTARRSRGAWVWGAAIVVLAAVAGAGYVEVQGRVTKALLSEAPPAAQAVPVSVATVEQRDTAIWTEFSGRLEAVGRVSVRPRVAGPILSANFREGALVRQGDPLFTIDPALYAADVQRAEAQVSAASARLALAARQQQRGFTLGSANDLARSDVDARVNEYRAADANLHAALAALDTAKLNLSYTEVRAPISGRAGKIEVTAGNLVEPGAAAPVLTTLVSVNPIYASFEADEQSVARAVASLPAGSELSATIGQIPVEMGTLASAGTSLRGHLQLIDNVVDGSSGTVRVRAVFDNADGRLMPGQFARLRLGEAKPERAIAIDERAIGTDQDHRFVMVVGADDHVSLRDVHLGASVDGGRIVTAGLHAGERIVVDGLQRVRPGALVAPGTRVASQ